jgi:ubiquinone/menaquinone biosynthesis C-methylase UbiE
VELFDLGRPATIFGVDPAQEAIKVAQQKVGTRNITFASHSAYELPFEANSFDIAYLRGVLHHMDRPVEALTEAFRVAGTVVVVEPNGYNPVLKLLERYSRYHVEHNEKSYAPASLDRWISQIGGHVCTRQYAGLVPMFCPDWMARSLKRIEPFGERLPLLNKIGCAVYVFMASRVEK